MRLLARVVILVRICEKNTRFLFHVQQLLAEILPMLSPPKDLPRLIRNHRQISTGPFPESAIPRQFDEAEICPRVHDLQHTSFCPFCP